MARLYLDANVFLQYRFQDIDWCALADSEQVVLVVVPEVFREIEKYKDQGRERLQDRARKASTWIGTVMREQNGIVRPNVRLALVLKDIPYARVEALGLSSDVGDDKILAAILEDEAGADTRVLVTAENLRRFKAEAHGLSVLLPPDDKKVADEPHPLEQENRRLKQQLDDRPKLAIGFEGKAPYAAVRLRVFPASLDDQENAIVEEERASLTGLFAKALRSILEVPPSELEIERYLKSFREWLVENYDTLSRARLGFSADLELRNDGRGTATDVEVSLSVPEHVFFAPPASLTVSRPPAQPRWRARMGALGDDAFLREVGLAGSGSGMAIAEMLAFEQADGRLDCDESHPHRAGFNFSSLKHTTAPRVSVPLWFASVDAALTTKGFSIGYRVHAAYPPEILEGDLAVKLDVEEIPMSAAHIKRK